MDKHFEVLVDETPEFETMRLEWTRLEKDADPPFFLSWGWIGTWLQTYKPKYSVVRVVVGSQIVGLSLLVARRDTRHGMLRSNTLRLNQTGDGRQDQVWIEYNGILSTKKNRERVLRAFGEALDRFDFEEFIISGIRAEEFNFVKHACDLPVVESWQAGTYGVDLKQFGRSRESFLDSLSRNTRYQIRRSLRICENLSLKRAESSEEALDMFRSIGPFHKKKWDDSGFHNPHFVRFHENLIKNCWQNEGVDIWQITNNQQLLGYVYLLLTETTAHFYLAGFEGVDDSRVKPGLMAHAHLISWYANQGKSYYDFLGGDERYKENLGKRKTSLHKVSFQRNLLKFRLENSLAALKSKIKTRTS